ncbi:cupin domain-containing protein [Marinobacterium litorale]|uniref:cupin domain-containing protein n=1 Tax=Marinobacterium litorale TaxID=404770 RepID=UPI0003FC1908|nr:cupin domain-containing protein [Marinobacterium litorale]
MSSITKLPVRSVEPITDDLPGWSKVEGSPSMSTWIEYTASDESMIAGWWTATPGIYHATYASWEFIHLIEGKAVITPEGGEPVEVNAGDAFVMEADFVGTWQIIEPILKHFTIRLK